MALALVLRDGSSPDGGGANAGQGVELQRVKAKRVEPTATVRTSYFDARAR